MTSSEPAPPLQRRRANRRGTAVAVVLCAGQGSRMGGERNKILLPLGDRPLFIHAVEAFERAATIAEILLIAHPREVELCGELARRYGMRKVRAVLPGGSTRHQSEWRALCALRDRILSDEVAVVVLHDGARPFISQRAIAAITRSAREVGGAVPAMLLDAGEVVVELEAGQRVARIFPAGQLWRAQTPQAFAARTLLSAYELAARDGFEGTDTAASVERAGGQVRIIAGSARNIKVTTPADLTRAESMLRSRLRPAAHELGHASSAIVPRPSR